jgi:hypothetical protein
MAGIKTCKGCGVPLMIGRNFTWQNNGVITQSHKPGDRMVFYDPEPFSRAIKYMEETIELPIDRIVIESTCRAARRFVSNLAPPIAFKLVRHVGFRQVLAYMCRMGRSYGYGDISPTSIDRRRGPGYHLDFIIRYPYDLSLFLGIELGVIEAIEGEDVCADYEQLTDEEFKSTIRLGEHLVELKGRLRAKEYAEKPGHIELQRCLVCGIPLEVAEYRWDVEKGIIRHPDSGERMAFHSPSGYEAIFADLEGELGEDIAGIVTEAWRAYTRDKPRRMEGLRDFDSLKRRMAVQGLGNLVTYEVEDESMSMTIESSCLPRMIVGFAQGLFEYFMNVRNSSCDWSLDDSDGTLRIEIKSA